MSTTIDERVVEMRFDNRQFEQNVQTSLSTLDKLKQSLDLNGAAQGLENLGEAAKKCNMSTLSSSVEAVQAKFSALEVMAMTALSNITNSAINAGKRLISQFTIEPVTTGFNEYELKMGSIQTIMASTGESLDRVNQKLDELNTYSDRTIYSFSDMTQNIGKFTNAGVKLDDAVAAIQGVSNVAAVSGANANEASRAMYNFAQALSAGYVKLIDWKSIENANMATVEFKNYLLDAAVAAGTLEKTADGMYKVLTTNANGGSMDEAIDATHMFNDSLSYQWMTTEVLTSTLKQYADETTDIGKKAFAAAQDIKTFSQLMDTLKESAQSGWATTWQLFVGDFEEAKKTLTEFNEFFSKILDTSANARNELLGGALTSNWGKLKNEVTETGISVDTFKETLREVASESVKGLDQMIEEAGSFDATLSQGWLTTEIFGKTLDKLANDATGTADGIAALSDEQLKNAGYTEEQIEALRNLRAEADATTGSFGSVSEMIANIGQQSGREMIFDSLLNALKGIQKLFETLKGAWDKVFPPATSEQLFNIIQGLHDFSERLIISDETADKISRTFQGLFSVLDIIKQAFSAVLSAVSPLFGGLGTLSGGILDVTASFGDWLVGLDEAVKKGDIFNKAIQKISGFIETVTSKVKAFFSAVKEKFNLPGFELFQTILERAQERIASLTGYAKGVKDEVGGVFDSIGSAISKSGFLTALSSAADKMSAFFNGVKTIGKAIIDAFGTLVSGIVDKLGGADFSGVLDLLNGVSFGAIALALTNFVKGMKDSVSDPGGVINTLKDFLNSGKDIFSNLKGVLDGVKSSLETWQQDIKVGMILKIAGALAILSASLIALSLIDSDKLSASLGALTVMFVELLGSMSVFSKIEGDAKTMKKNAATLIEMSAAILILSSALKKIADLDAGQLTTGLIGIAGLMAGLVASFKILSSGEGTAVKGATQMILFAAAIKILASACEDLSQLSWDELAKGLVGVGALLAEVDVFLNTAKFSGKGMTTATGIVILSAAIKVLASACKDFGEMQWEEIGKGLASVGALLLEVAAFTNLTGNAKHVVSTGLALIEIGAAMKIFASAVDDFGKLGWEKIATGLTAMGGALAEITLAVNLMPKNMVGIGVGLIAVGGALEILANVLGKMGNMSWEQIAAGLVVLGGSLAELAIALNLMNGTLAGSAAMVVAAGALAVLTPVLLVLGSMSWESIAKGLVTLAGAFTVIGVAGAVLTPLVPSILGLAGAIALIGVGAVGIGAGLALIGAGLTAIAAGVTALAVSLGAGVTVIVAGLTAIVTGIAALIPAIAEKFGEAIVAFCQVIIDGVPAIGEAIKALVLTIVDVLVECVPAIADGALQLVTGVLAALVTYTPQIVDSLMQFLIEVLEGIARNLPTLIQAAIDVLMSFFTGIVGALKGIDTSALLEGIAGVGLLSGIMVALSAVAGLVPGAMAGVLGMGAIIAELALVLAAVGALAQLPGLSWLINEGGQLLQGIGTAIGGFVGGIVGGFMSGVSSQFPQIGADLSAFMTNVKPFIDGASSIGPEMLTGIKALTEVILILTAADIINGLTSWLTGGSSLTDFADQLVPFGESMTKFSQAISGMDADLVSQAAIAGKTLAEMAATIPNSGGVVGFFAGENDMETFGEQLVSFGDAMMQFSNKVKGMDADAVVNASIAGKAMAEMAATLPNSGGVVGFFAGENDMSSFGAQLVPFGVAMKAYSLAVKGLDVDAITNSATAGKTMIELANTLPNCGGVVGFFTGENNLDTFGAQLLTFGVSIKAYSLAVSGLDTDAITNSATAGKALVELANTLPNTGGLVSFFTGDNNIADFGDDLILFGEDLAAYAAAIQDVKPEIVTASANAAAALSNLASGLPDSSLFDQWFGGDQTLASFGDDISAFGEDMGAYYSKIAGIDTGKLAGVVTQVWSLVDLAKGVKDVDKSAFSNFGNSLESLANTGITGFTNAFYNANDQVNSAVLSMLNSVSSSITSNSSVVVPAMEDVVSMLVEAVNDSTSTMSNAVVQMMNNFSTAIRNNGTPVRTAMTTVLTSTVTAINGTKTSFTQAGVNVGQGFVNGINSMKNSASTAGRNLGLAALNAAKRALDSHSPSREFIYLGENMGEGLAIGVKNSIVPASQATSDMIGEVIAVSSKGLDAFKEWAEEKKYYNELSLKDELAGYENLQKMYKAGSEERKQIDREVYRLQNELVSSTYQASLDWIEEEKYYNRLSTEEELAAYERMQSRYLEGSEERMEIDRKVYSLRNQLMEESYQNSMDWIEEEKYYNRMSLAEELAAYKRVQSRYAKGTEERKKMDREVYRVEKEISDAQKQYIEDVQQVQTQANQKRLDLEQEYADKVEQINDKLASDIKSLNDEYENQLESRAQSLYQSYGLFDEVKEREEVSGETLMKNLEGQVQEFGEWQDVLDQLSGRGLDSELIEELQEMGPSALAQLEALNSMSDEELEKYASLWSVKHAQAREQAVSELEGLRQETLANIEQLRVDADQELNEYRAVWQENMAQVTADANAELARLQQEFAEKVGLIKTNTDEELEEMAETAQKILTEAGWDETGQAIVDGLTEGVQEKRSSFIDELTSMALAGVEAVQSTLEINSPSRVFKELGEYTGLGFVNGLSSYTSKTYTAGVDMAESAKYGLSNTIQTIAEMIESGIDAEPTIRPVIDLTNAAQGVNDLNSMFSNGRTLGLAGQASMTLTTNSGSEPLSVKVETDDVVKELHSLRSDMASMLDRLERLRIVLDSGTLVGELVAPMDSALGQRSTYKGRGN